MESAAFLMTVAAVAAYLCGSIPFGLILGRLVGGIDIRKHGSGNIGATNVSRLLGAKWGITVLLLDALKGLLPVWGVAQLEPLRTQELSHHAQVLCGAFAIVGHMFPCWLGFRGGKGVATALGVVVMLSWQGSLAAFATFVLTFAITRWVSLGSVLGSVAYVVAHLWLTPAPFSAGEWSRTLFSLLVPALIILRHRSNLVRIRRGEEPRFQFGGKRGAAMPPVAEAKTIPPRDARESTSTSPPETKSSL